MAAEWYYQVMGGVIGPLSPASLLEHAQTGKLTRSTLVRRGDNERWVVAEKVRGLFPSLVESPAIQLGRPVGRSGDQPSATSASSSRQNASIVYDTKRITRVVTLIIIGLAGAAAAAYLYREKFPSDDRILARFRTELRDSSSGWESTEVYRSKSKDSDFEYKALHAVYREGGVAFWFGAGINWSPSHVTVSTTSVPPSNATSEDGLLASIFVKPDGQIESEKYYGVAAFSPNAQVLFRRKAQELYRAAAAATGKLSQ